MNKYERIPEEIIDLHGYTMREAEEVLHTLLGGQKFSHVRIIVGKGNHGVNGSVLRDFVKKYLTLRNIRFSQSKLANGGEGALEVFLK
jgi:DNA-nicking Smr family endonuclease